jgi:cellobiose phosphorylase
MEMLLKVQNTDGSAMHQFNPVTMIANRGDSAEMEDRPDFYGDDHLWIVLAVCAYIKETGNTDFLNKQIPFYEKDKNGEPIEAGSVLEHLNRAIEFTRSNLGANGLPLLGFADWNDTVNLPTGAVSVFNANLYGYGLKELVDILSYMGKDDLASKYKGYYEDMKDTLNKVAWDGDWYIRYFDHNGNPIGSSKNEKGKIYVNAQSWSVMSGFATKERALKALESVNRHLNSSKGIMLSAPGYNGFDPEIGGITTYPPGAKENCGIFMHTNPWAIIAETLVGNGDRAYEYYNQINPIAKNDIIDEYESEPYVYPQNVLGKEHPQFGLARNSWLSGTSSWTYQAATKNILGIRPQMEGLEVNPCIPADWKGFKVKRKFRGAIYNISVNNDAGVNRGVKSILVDGKEIEGNIVPIFSDGKEHTVELVMG